MSDASSKKTATFADLSAKQRLMVAGYETAAFAITRYPYLCAVLQMVSFPEELHARKDVRSDAFSWTLVNLGVYFVSATVMSFDLFGLKRLFALLFSAHIGFVSIQEYSYSGQKDVVLSRMLCRNLANIGVYLSVAGGLAHGERGTDRNKLLLSFGRQMLGAYAFLQAAIIYNSREEFKAYVESWPLGKVGPYIAIACFTMCCFCIYGGYEVVMLAKVLSWLLLVVTVTVDTNSRYWLHSAGLKYWTCMMIASRNVPVIAALLLIRPGFV